jgi:branched-chain amino acid transport system substrate-binding protein
MRKLYAVLAMTSSLAFASPTLAAETVKVGGLFDLTGVTADVGKPFVEGVKDAVSWINENGGVGGKKIDLIAVDYGYKVPQATAAYKKFVEQDKVILIEGWGSGDTEALRDLIAKDKIPYFSAGFNAHLNDPAKAPYNFFVGASYSDQVRAFMQFVKKDFKDKSRKPKVVFIYPNNGFGKSPIEAGRQYAKEAGIELLDDQVTPPTGFQDATTQLLAIQKGGADYAFIQNTVSWAAVILKDAKKLGLKTKFFLNNYGMTEQLPDLAKDAAEGVYGMVTTVPYGVNVPGMKKITDWHKNHHATDSHNLVYVRGWVYALTWGEALRIADKNKQLNGEGVKKAIESMKNFDTGGLVQPATYSSTDHRASTKSAVYQVKGGKLVKVEEFEVPRKKEWLGL